MSLARGSVLVLFVASTTACVTDPESSPPVGLDAAADVAPRSSACGACLQTHCPLEVKTCAGEPSCAAYLTCMSGCPDSGGVVDAACVTSCAAHLDEPARVARGSLDACAASSSCGACGPTTDAGPRHPVLSQSCPPVDPLRIFIDDCTICRNARCCETRDACFANSECVALRACFEDEGCAGDHACQLRCYEKHPTGIDDSLRHAACTTVVCVEPCVLAPKKKPDPCAECLFKRCGDTFAACLTDPGCQALWICLDPDRTDKASVDACKERFPAGVRRLDDNTLCGADRCFSECFEIE